jgi:hypothetical protein
LFCPLRLRDPNPKGPLRNIVEVDPPIGPETEAFFDEVDDLLQTVPPDEPMEEDTSSPCDFDIDGVCDAQDIQIFQGALGTCASEQGFDPQADADGSGCADLLDQTFLFDLDADGLLVDTDNCPNVSNEAQADADDNGIGDLCQCGDVNADGVTNVTDALVIARGQVSSGGEAEAHCDVNGDRFCNVSDALILARGQQGSAPEDQRCPAYLEVTR